MKQDILFACSTFPDIETARRIAQELVTERLIACANLIPGVESIYRWEGDIENASEVLVFFKLTTEGYTAFQEKLHTVHPYDVPEIICLQVADGLPHYLQWVSACCSRG